MKIFISYPDKDGLDKAMIAYVALKRYRHDPWYFDKHRTLGYLYFEELTYRIRKWCDAFLYLCTQSSPSCDGQRWETAQVLKVWTKIHILAIPINDAVIPETIDVFSYNKNLDGQNFKQEFEDIATNFEDIVAKYRRLDSDLKASVE